MVHERLLHHLLRLTQRRQPTTETFDALVPKVFAVAEAAGLQRCTDEEEAQLARYVRVRQPPPSGRQCVAEEDVYMVARLVDEDADNQYVSLLCTFNLGSARIVCCANWHPVVARCQLSFDNLLHFGTAAQM